MYTVPSFLICCILAAKLCSFSLAFKRGGEGQIQYEQIFRLRNCIHACFYIYFFSLKLQLVKVVSWFLQAVLLLACKAAQDAARGGAPKIEILIVEKSRFGSPPRAASSYPLPTSRPHSSLPPSSVLWDI